DTHEDAEEYHTTKCLEEDIDAIYGLEKYSENIEYEEDELAEILLSFPQVIVYMKQDDYNSDPVSENYHSVTGLALNFFQAVSRKEIKQEPAAGATEFKHLLHLLHIFFFCMESHIKEKYHLVLRAT
ncbi:PREDICTED: UPF0481 At3g47200, partial [Prunus dulcis]